MIKTYGKFYYGHSVNITNRFIDFKEGAGPDLVATIDIGEFSLTDYLAKVATALNIVGTNDYFVTVDRATRVVTISSTGAFTILGSTGANDTTSALPMLGFDLVDTSSATSHVGQSASGSEWVPQFLPQDSAEFDNNQQAIDGAVKQSTNGTVEAFKFGIKKIMECNYRYITDIYQSSGGPVLNDQNGVLNARTFMEYATTKSDLEFMADKTKPDAFVKCILESTNEDKDGLSFKLKELYSQGLVGYFETGLLKFRKIED